MLRISKLTDYAILIVGQLANNSGAALSATLLAKKLHLNTPTVSKILKILSEAQLVYATRGVEGGYHLCKPAAQITIADVVSAMEGRVAVTECCKKSGLCAIDTFCTLKENWMKINNILNAVLAQWTIQDILKPL